MELPDYRQYRLISVDIFDTLLLRTVAKAADLFEIVWEEAEKGGIAALSISKKESMVSHLTTGAVTLEAVYGNLYPVLIFTISICSTKSSRT